MTEQTPSADPVRFRVETPPALRSRLKALARPLLILPHALLVGGPEFCFLGFASFRPGAYGMFAWLLAVLDWFAILLTGAPVEAVQSYKRDYLRWRARVLAYGAFLRDEYPPFGEGSYPVTLDLPEAPAWRDKTSVLLRILLALPHLAWLFLLLAVWAFVGVFSWLWISLTASLPGPVWGFSRDVMGYALRVEAYVLLLHDEFPPFSLPGEDAARRAG